VITLVKYDEYQQESTANQTAERQQKDPNNNVNNVNNVNNIKREEINSSSPKKLLKKNLEERKEAFRAEIFSQGYLTKYSSAMLNEFFKYWSEPNPSKTKMKFEMQQTWDLSGRLVRWNSNQHDKPESKAWDTKTEDQSNFG